MIPPIEFFVPGVPKTAGSKKAFPIWRGKGPSKQFVRSVIVDDAGQAGKDWRASVRQAQAAELIGLVQELGKTNPQIAVAILDLVVEAMDISQREEIVKRIRQVTGMSDPDAEEKTPEEMARAQAQQAAAQRAIAMEEAQIAKTRAEAIAKSAGGEKSLADKKLSEAKAILTNVQAMMTSIEAALAAVVTAQAAPIADQMLTEAGFTPASDGTFTPATASAGVPAGPPELLPNAAHPNKIPISPGAAAAPPEAAEGAM